MGEQNIGKSPFGDQSGMTLIEVMVACVILLVGILGLALLQVNAINGNAAARRVTEASNTVSDRIEQIMSGVWTGETVGADLAAGPHAATSGKYSVAWQVVDASDGGSKTVNVTVSWPESGRTRQISQVIVRTLK